MLTELLSNSDLKIVCVCREEPIDYKILEEGLRHACRQLNLKDVDGFLLKCIQLFETTIVRHG